MDSFAGQLVKAMRCRTRCCVLAFLLWGVFAPRATLGTEIWSYHYVDLAGVNGLLVPEATFNLPISVSHYQFSLFKDVNVGFATLGKTFTATAANDHDFSSVVQVLTDGFNSQIVVGSFGGPESFYFKNVVGGNGIDLQGFMIDAVTERLDVYTYRQPGSDPNHDGFWTDIRREATITIQGHAVPEPPAMTMFAIALAGLMACRCRTGESRRPITSAHRR